MGKYTPRYALYLAGGGSTGTITPDEPVDIDKINDAFSRIDAALGVTVVADANLPATPGVGKLFKTTTTDNLVYHDGSNYQSFLPTRLTPTGMGQLYYTQKQLNEGALDGRYFTEDELLNGGAIDGRYYTKTLADQKAANFVTKDMLGTTSGDQGLKFAMGSATASGFNGPDGTTGRYQIGVPIVINPTPFKTNNVRLFGIAWSQDYGAVTVQQDPDFLTGSGGGRLIVNRRNAVTTTISWFAIGY